MNLAFVFPGQGSQVVGMGAQLAQDFIQAKLVFSEVDDALGQNLSKLMFEGPEEELFLTENAQPAIMAVSIATARVLEKDFGIKCSLAKYAAGHSLGEYSAHAAAGTFSLSDTAKLLKIRGKAMQKAVPAGIGSMAALIGPKADMALAESACAFGAHHGIVVVANDNSVGQIVISGEAKAVNAAVEYAKENGVKATMLNVSAPFHCPMMEPAAEAMHEALKTVSIREPETTIIANFTAKPIGHIDDIADLLVKQVTGRVRWRESALWLGENGEVSLFAELGAGKVLTGMLKRLCPQSQSMAINTSQDFEVLANILNQKV